MPKKLQENSVWAKYDIDQDGTVSDEELEHIKKRRALKEAVASDGKIREAIIGQCMEEHQWENKEGHKWWDSEEKDMYYQDVKAKNIYVYYLNKKIKKKLLK